MLVIITDLFLLSNLYSIESGRNVIKLWDRFERPEVKLENTRPDSPDAEVIELFPPKKTDAVEGQFSGEILSVQNKVRQLCPFRLEFTEEELRGDEIASLSPDDKTKLLSFAAYVMQRKILPQIESTNDNQEISTGIKILGGLINILEMYEIDKSQETNILYYKNFKSMFCKLDPVDINNYSNVIKDYIYCGSEFGLFECEQPYEYNYSFDEISEISRLLSVASQEIDCLEVDPSPENFKKIAAIFRILFQYL